MRRLFLAATAAATLAAGLAVPGAASAQQLHRVDHDDGDAIAAGVAGLIIGGALGASSRGGYYDGRYGGYYDYGRGYYWRGYYDYRPRYDRRYYPRNYSPRGYYYDRPYRYRQRCRMVTVWDPYYGRVRERRCW